MMALTKRSADSAEEARSVKVRSTATHSPPHERSLKVTLQKTKTTVQDTTPHNTQPPVLTEQTIAAANAVFNTFKLVGKILLHLDTRSLFFAPQVCCMSQAVTAESKQLQQKLFMQPATFDKAVELGLADSSRKWLLLTHVVEGDDEPAIPVLDFYQTSERTASVLNPLFFRNDRSCQVKLYHPQNEGSWRRMFFTQPSRALTGHLTVLTGVVRVGQCEERMGECEVYDGETFGRWCTRMERESGIKVDGRKVKLYLNGIKATVAEVERRRMR